MGKCLRRARREFLLDHHLPATMAGYCPQPLRRVAMLHMRRCGNSLRGQMLAAQGEIFCAGAIQDAGPLRY